MMGSFDFESLVNLFSIVGCAVFFMFMIGHWRSTEKEKHQETQLDKNKLGELEKKLKSLSEKFDRFVSTNEIIKGKIRENINDIEKLKIDNRRLDTKAKNLQKQLNYLKRKCRNSNIN
ncbi:hypothetical protein SD427_18825 (plasmid) [Chryseobacterium sp. JJR-5R]|uniref:hypothetical protein n=1 Tax=Chryseobacterium sp. JJR-5R TaxID=3093923 RepID=UPI002A75364F|nr:hypothetical protein [Chryseobacterium sp. JJR-5R]WPO84654.1 hypothetical protein SD427_18825 [Chryseobacterium sp. JJR-5R]